MFLHQGENEWLTYLHRPIKMFAPRLKWHQPIRSSLCPLHLQERLPPRFGPFFMFFFCLWRSVMICIFWCFSPQNRYFGSFDVHHQLIAVSKVWQNLHRPRPVKISLASVREGVNESTNNSKQNIFWRKKVKFLSETKFWLFLPISPFVSGIE